MASREQYEVTLTDFPHPGEIVVEYLQASNWSQSDLARRTDLTPKTISEICNAKSPITPQTALAFEKVFQRPASVWLNLQRQYDESAARRRQEAKSQEWRTWAKRFPLAAMRKHGFIPAEEHAFGPDQLLAYLGVSSPSAWDAVWDSARVAYRQTRRFKTSPESIAVWVRETEIEAAKIDVAPYDESKLRGSLAALRHITRERGSEIIGPVVATCASAGVAVVWVPELPGTAISGCARWLTPQKAVVGLTLRYKWDDQMWFTFFHELGHILLHRRSRAFVLDNADDSLTDTVVDPEMQQQEEEANRFASDTLIPPDALSRFLRANDVVENDALVAFAEEIDIGPGVVVGRLQHDKVLKPHQGNAYRQRLSFGFEPPTEQEQ